MRTNYFEEGSADPFSYLLPQESPFLEAIRNAPHVKVVAPRLSFSGLISHGDITVSFLGQGVDPAKEEELSKNIFIMHGRRLSFQQPDGIVLGQGLASNVGVEVGDTVVLLAGTASGGINAVEARVRGLFVTSAKAFDDSTLRVPITMARRLLRVEGAHSWMILLDETRYTKEVLKNLKAAVVREAMDIDLVPWYELADFYNKTVALFSRQLNVVYLIIGVIIVLSISNMLIMSVLERTREVGTLMAIGFRRRKILRLFVAEGAWLGVLGGAIGVGAGLVLAQAINVVGIPMPPPPGMDVGFDAEIRVTWQLVTGAVALALTTTMLASLYPAWKASRLDIVNALRYNR